MISFVLPVYYRHQHMECRGMLYEIPYSYKITLYAAGNLLTIEPDEERNLRIVQRRGTDRLQLDPALLAAIARTLAKILDAGNNA
jgi:hypothetical protein